MSVNTTPAVASSNLASQAQDFADTANNYLQQGKQTVSDAENSAYVAQMIYRGDPTQENLDNANNLAEIAIAENSRLSSLYEEAANAQIYADNAQSYAATAQNAVNNNDMQTAQTAANHALDSANYAQQMSYLAANDYPTVQNGDSSCGGHQPAPISNC